MLVGQAGSTPVFNFTGALSFGGNLTFSPYGANSHGNVNFYGPSITFPNNDSTFTINDYSGDTVYHTYSAVNCSLIYYGQRCAFTDNNNRRPDNLIYKTFKNFLLQPNAQVIKNGLYETRFQDSTSPLILKSGAHLTVNGPTNFYLTADGSPCSIASATLDGTSSITFGLNNNNITGHLPTLNYTGSGTVNFIDGTVARTGILWNQEGALKLNTGTCGIYLTNTDSTATFNCNNYDMTCGPLKSGIDNRSNFIINWGLGKHIINSYDGATHNSATGTCIQAFQKSNWDCSGGNWTFGSRHIINYIPGNSTLNFSGPSILTSNGKYLNFVTISNANSDSSIAYGTDSTSYGGSIFYVDINSSYDGTTGTGTTGSPFSYAQFLAYTPGSNDAFRLRGARNSGSSFNKTSYTGVGWHIEAWDLQLYGPWRISGVNNSTVYLGAQFGTMTGGINYAQKCIMVARKITNMLLKSTQDMELGANAYGMEFKGCTLIGAWEPAIPSNQITFYDCVVDMPLNAVISVWNNCAFTVPSWAAGTKNNCQFSWTPPVWPAWDASKENFSRTFLNFSTITSPPSPGTGSPDYTGYPVNLWGTVRDNIGISYAGLDSMVILADDFK
jgi:hypothetical protein